MTWSLQPKEAGLSLTAMAAYVAQLTPYLLRTSFWPILGHIFRSELASRQCSHEDKTRLREPPAGCCQDDGIPFRTDTEYQLLISPHDVV